MANAGGGNTSDMLDIKDDYSNSLFQCCVCLDLLYKPIVLPCGHISCFWCVHRAMHAVQESQCAICRQSYNHFPSICQLLHLLISKLEPAAYKRREKEVIDEEKNTCVQSPQFVDEVTLPNSGSTNESEGSTSTNLQHAAENARAHGLSKSITVEDALCCLCNEFLYLPLVLNCGHVYCDTCLSSMAGEKMECKVCRALHPGQFPNVCLDLDHFLEENFPEEYATRRQAALVKKAQHQHRDTSSSSSSAQGDGDSKKKLHASILDGVKYNIHIGVGCDYCGLYPIKGKRYKCMDCKEQIGFDLCELCYNTNSKLPGRFNQQHTSDHRFELDDSTLLSRILLRGAVAEEFDENDDAGEDGGNDVNLDQV